MVSKLAMATAFASSFLLLPAHAETPACMEVGGTATSRFTGRLTRPVFPGPPNYEDVRRGDAREPAYILTLDRPACVNAAGDDNLSRHPSRRSICASIPAMPPAGRPMRRSGP